MTTRLIRRCPSRGDQTKTPRQFVEGFIFRLASSTNITGCSSCEIFVTLTIAR
jgi:hypothetical protein